MILTLTDKLVARTAVDGQAVPFIARVFTDTVEPWVLVIPTTLRYRIDDPERRCTILDWTTVTPANTATITVTGSQNSIDRCMTREWRRITVQADSGLATSCVETRDYYVTGIRSL